MPETRFLIFAYPSSIDSETQPRTSHLINGEISWFSVDQLIHLLVKAWMQVTIDGVLKT